MKNLKEIWSNLDLCLKRDLNPRSYQTWINPLKVKLKKPDSIELGAPNKFFKNWLEEHYLSLINEKKQQIKNAKDIKIKFIISKNTPSQKTKGKSENKKFKNIKSSLNLKLNVKFTFDNFVIGSSNRFAHAASMAVAESPAKSYNPLFIYGGVGLGKTHLMQAIVHFAVNNHKTKKAYYISSEDFTNQLISAIQNRKTLSFRDKFRNVDILLIDDIHFIAGKESTQEEFFHTFNTLYDSHKQIVVCSDRSPKEIPTLEERLVSRFEWGLVTDIQPPNLETRIAILRKKAQNEPITIPDEVISFIAENITTNIRELEGALIRVVAHSTLIGSEINLDLAKNILKDMVIEKKKIITVDQIQRVVAQYFDIRISDMKTKSRVHSITYPRQIAMFLSKKFTDHSLNEIGNFFGGKDHTTILHACKKIKKEIKNKPKTNSIVKKLNNALNSN